MSDNNCSCGCASSIGTSSTVDAVIARIPSAIHVLNAYGVDTCCGGAATLGDAANHIRVDPSVLLESIEKAAQP